MNRSNRALSADVQPLLPHANGALLVNLMSTRDAVKDLYRDCLARHDLTEQQWRVLSVLWLDTKQDATRLAERTSLLPSSLTRIISYLEKRGLISTRRDPSDARRTELRLSPSGLALMKVMTPDIQIVESRIASVLGVSRLETLMAELQRARNILNDNAELPGLRRRF